MRKPITEIADLHDLVETLTDLAWALSEYDRGIQFTLMDGTHHIGRAILVDSGPLDDSDKPPYFAELTVEFGDGTTRTFSILDLSSFGPHQVQD